MQEARSWGRDDLVRFEQAKHTAYRLIEYAPRSTEEIRYRLRLKHFSDAIIDRVVTQFLSQDLLDDRRFARLVVRRARFTKPQGRVALRIELKRKGIGDAIIREAMEEFSAEEENRLALEAAARRFRDQAFPGPEVKKRRIYEFLRRRGFAGDAARTVAERLTVQKDSL